MHNIALVRIGSYEIPIQVFRLHHHLPLPVSCWPISPESLAAKALDILQRSNRTTAFREDCVWALTNPGLWPNGFCIREALTGKRLERLRYLARIKFLKENRDDITFL